MALVAVLTAVWHIALAQSGASVVTGDARVDRLLDQMTLAEKLTLIHDGREEPRRYQGQAGYISGVPRLGIPGLRLAAVLVHCQRNMGNSRRQPHCERRCIVTRLASCAVHRL
jgi:hypothetical protein